MHVHLGGTRILANGLSTDHPVPDLPFVDDSHLPLDDLTAFEAVGRDKGPDTWGRVDRCKDGGHVAFTTDPTRTDLAWCLREHPEHGRSIILVADADASGLHVQLQGAALLIRAGGYWWDGSNWNRPPQLYDRSAGEFLNIAVPAATTITAIDMLPAFGNPAMAALLPLDKVDIAGPADAANWSDHLAMWAARRTGRRPLDQCVVTLTAPELTGNALIGLADLAGVAGIAASTLRAYIARSEATVPASQAQISGRHLWSRPVAEEWAQARRLDDTAAAIHVTHPAGFETTPGKGEIAELVTGWFISRLWNDPALRHRWTLRWRTEKHIRGVAEQLAWDVASSLGRFIPMEPLTMTIRHALLDELRRERDLTSATQPNPDDWTWFGITWGVTRTLDWLIRYEPDLATGVISETVQQAIRELDIPRHVVEDTLRTALSVDSKIPLQERTEYLDRVFGHPA